ncbi:hypothetical protein XF36_08910 [Pseudonocardia sp. HH130629-09]|nr:hypothetical protein XF36_08910 [Pseudonocardia sp. HH130629-09]
MVHNHPMPDESDTALLYVDRGLVRADQGPPDRAAQQRARSRARLLRALRWSWSTTVVLIVLVLLLPGPAGAGLLVAALLLVLLVALAVFVAARSARTAQAVAGLPVPIEVAGRVAPSMRSVLAMSRVIGSQPVLRRSRTAAEGVVLVRRWSASAEGLREAWLRGDVAAWHEHALSMAAAGERAERVRAEVETGH